MTDIVGSIRHNLVNLLRFSGRDTRAQFWPWAILVFLISQAASLLAMIPPAANAVLRVAELAEAAQMQKPGSPPVPVDPITSEIVAGFADLWLPLALINVGTVLLLAAAVVRRLHDRDRTGLWGLLPLPFMAAGIANTRAAFELASRQSELSQTEQLVFLSGPLFWLVLVVLVVLLAGESHPYPNRFGPEP